MTGTQQSKWAVVALVFGLALALYFISTQEKTFYAPKREIAPGYLPVRDGIGAHHKVVAMVKPGDEIRRTELDWTDWDQIRTSGGALGWVHSDFFDNARFYGKPEYGIWVVLEETDPLTDYPTVIISQSGADHTSFVIRCKNDKTEVYVDWRSFLAGDVVRNNKRVDFQNVTIRVGEDPAVQEEWSISTSKDSTFSPAAIPLIKSMLKGHNVILQTTPYNKSPVTLAFETTGLDKAILPLRSACHW